jgi:hypothetical protein
MEVVTREGIHLSLEPPIYGSVALGRGVERHGGVEAGDRVVARRCGFGKVEVDSAVANRTGVPGRAGADPAGVSRGSIVFAVGRGLGLHHQTVQRCVERAVAEGPMAALDDRPRPGNEPTITLEAKAWLISLAGYPHELWTTRLLASHAREHGPAEGHVCLANLAQGTVCKILAQEDVKPHKVRYYLERRDPDFAEKMAEVLCVYRQVKLLKKAAGASRKKPNDDVAVISYDDKPGIQAIATTAPDLPPVPGAHATFAREHEYKRHGTVTLLAGINLLTGKVHALVKDRHRSREFIEFLKLLDRAYPPSHRDPFDPG